MKNVLLSLAFLCLTQLSMAQKIYAWADVGLKAGYGLTGFLNTNLLDASDYDYQLATGNTFGGKVGLFFGLFNGITCDVLLSKSSQKLDYAINSRSFDHKITWSNIDIDVLYRLQKDGVYIELGPQISLLRKVTNGDPNDPTRTDVKEFYNKKYYSGILGIGGYIFNYETFTTMLGFRLGYGLTDLINEAGKAKGFPTPSQVDLTKKASEKSTNAAFVQLVIEANFALGYYGKSSCSKRATLFNF